MAGSWPVVGWGAVEELREGLILDRMGGIGLSAGGRLEVALPSDRGAMPMVFRGLDLVGSAQKMRK